MKQVALLALVALYVMSSASCQVQPAIQSQPADVAKQFVGLWRLTSRPQRLADGTTRQNPISVAYIVYTDTGHMCFVSMDPNRPKWKSAAAPTGEEATSAILGSGAYCSTVEIHAQEGFVLHDVEISTFPNSVGAMRKRWFTFEGPDRLSLRVDAPELASGVVEGTLIWERVKK